MVLDCPAAQSPKAHTMRIVEPNSLPKYCPALAKPISSLGKFSQEFWMDGYGMGFPRDPGSPSENGNGT